MVQLRDQKSLLSRLALMDQSATKVDDDDPLAELEAFLQPRIKAAEASQISERSVGEIFQEVYEELGYDVNA